MLTFFLFEVRYWLSRPMVWIFLLINALLVMGAVSTDDVVIGGGVGSVYKNAPSVIQTYYGVMSLLCLLMTTAFMNASANRDFATGMYQFVFSSPIQKRDYFFGKFFGALLIAILPLLGVSIGALIGPYMPWAEADRYGPVILQGHVQGLLSFGIPNTFIVAVWLFGLAILFRNNLVSFIGAILILVVYLISQGFTADLEKEWLANLLDPFGFQPLEILSKYQTVEEQNAAAVPLTGPFLLNRLYWIGLSLLLLSLLYWRFSFSTRKEKSKAGSISLTGEAADLKLPQPSFQPIDPPAGNGLLRQWVHLTLFEIKAIIRNPIFLVVLLFGAINLVASLTSFTGNYGMSKYPVTYDVVEVIRGAFYLFLVGIITFYTGVLIWKERDVNISEIEDATPINSGAYYLAKLVAMLTTIFIILSCTIGIGMVTQLLYGYTDVKPGVYIRSLLVLDMLEFTYLVVIAFLMHYLINNRYIAYFAFVVFVILNNFLWSALEIDTNMLPFGATPFAVYSDMNGFGPFVPGLLWFHIYWILASCILLVLVFSAYIRGRESSFRLRWQTALGRIRKKSILLSGLLILFILCGGFVYYNTQMLNDYTSSKESERHQKEYEEQYKKYKHIPQPRWVAFQYDIDLSPYSRDLQIAVEATAVNKHTEPIRELLFSMPDMPDTVILTIPTATLSKNDARLGFRTYTLDPPLQPGDSMAIRLDIRALTRGFENEVSFTQLTRNGTFFNNFDFMPMFGYQIGYEITDKNKRKKLGLPRRDRMPPLNPADSISRGNTYLSNDADWVQVKTIMRTAPDQIAVAPGSLIREWEEDGKRCFEYELDHSALNFYSFISARYEVAREKWNGIDLEVYHIAEHAYNVPNMLRSMRESLSYYTANFGPYRHKQCRIIEFPRYASFAQAFPGTMPYSEGIGFIADLRDVEKGDIDMAFYVVAHEMAHQYWAHQLIGADMQGSEWMSEGFSQYAALMVMEKAYGREQMHRFLRYEMNDYLEGRGTEFEAERPLYLTEGQPYIHYNKASVAMFYLKEMIGEEQVNAALRDLLEKFAYRNPPYPTSLDALQALQAHTPDSLQYLISDLFQEITLYSNRVVNASFRKVEGGYAVTLETASEKMYSDSLGKNTPQALRDYIDIGVFAEPEGKKKIGKMLAYQRVLITEAENTYTLLVQEKPYEAGIDPYRFLVDRIPDDNLDRVQEAD